MIQLGTLGFYIATKAPELNKRLPKSLFASVPNCLTKIFLISSGASQSPMSSS